MAFVAVLVIAGPIQNGWHEAGHFETVLLAQRLAELKASDLRDRIALVRGLQWPAEQRLFIDRLLSELRVDGAAA